jgi:hypothetical protein
MKLLIGFLLFSSFQLFSQSYLNILFSNGDYKNSRIDSLTKITLSSNGELIYFHKSDGYIYLEDIANIKTFTFSDTAQGQSIPVELSSFNAVQIGSSILLKWRTETEMNNYGFEIERANELNRTPQKWVKIGFVEGHGNSTIPEEYTFNDNPAGYNIYHYRLKQIDLDGKYEYSNVVSVKINSPDHYSLNQNFPNPFNPATKISYNIPADGFVIIKIFDVLGNEVASLINDNQKAGSHIITFDGSKYSSGIYILRLSSGNYSSSIKMTLMK